jgi:hemolysin III
MGWLVLGVIRTLIERLPQTAVLLLLGGGIVLTVGAFIHTRHRLPFHNAAWHALVLVGTGLHLAALHVAFAPWQDTL